MEHHACCDRAAATRRQHTWTHIGSKPFIFPVPGTQDEHRLQLEESRASDTAGLTSSWASLPATRATRVLGELVQWPADRRLSTADRGAVDADPAAFKCRGRSVGGMAVLKAGRALTVCPEVGGAAAGVRRRRLGEGFLEHRACCGRPSAWSIGALRE